MARGISLYVSADGSDANPGTEARPFATIERARDAIRGMKTDGAPPAGGVTVWIRGGTYELDRPLRLEAGDGGVPGAPIVYRSCEGEMVRLSGGRVVTGWKPVTEPQVLARMDPEARPHVLQADLRGFGVTDYGSVESARKWAESSPGIELFFADAPTTLARWPNAGEPYARISGFPGGATPYLLRDRPVPDSSAEGRFLYDGDRPKR